MFIIYPILETGRNLGAVAASNNNFGTPFNTATLMCQHLSS